MTAAPSIRLILEPGVTYRLALRSADILRRKVDGKPELRLIADVDGQTRSIYLGIACLKMLEAGGATVERSADGVDYVQVVRRAWELRLIVGAGGARHELVPAPPLPGARLAPIWSAVPSGFSLRPSTS